MDGWLNYSPSSFQGGRGIGTAERMGLRNSLGIVGPREYDENLSETFINYLNIFNKFI
jgi:hypothetical protein